MLHLANDSLNHGNLDEFSTFPFENALGHLKKMLRSLNKPLQQVARKLHLKQIDLLQEKLYNLSGELPQTEFDYGLFFKLQTPDWVFRNEKDVYFYTVNDKFVRVKKIRTKQGEGYDSMSNIHFECDVFKGNFVNMFTSPCDSVQMKIYKLKKPEIEHQILLSLIDIRFKCKKLSIIWKNRKNSGNGLAYKF